ncbi:glutamine synthetase/guanido kinase [Acephala macrosclerotiorum]|nr:glutamine synthetase/guanido kinase [Acephala macrosclerotiorum]
MGSSVSNEIKHLENFLANNPDINFIRYLWLDYSGILAIRICTVHFATSLVKERQSLTTLCSILTALVIENNTILDDLLMRPANLWPDWSSLKVCRCQPHYAQAMYCVDKGTDLGGEGFGRFPRRRLLEPTQDAKTKHGLDFLIGTEIEFFIMKDTKCGPQHLDAVPNTYSAASLNNEYFSVIEEIVRLITKAGILVRQFHGEGGPGVFEILTEPLPLQSADTLVYCQESIKSICRKHGLHGTMSPKPFEKLTGIGLHYNVSMSPNDKEDSFLVGLLDHWKALAAFYTSNYDNYTGVKPGAQGTWAFENRTAAIRKIRAGGR